jgi:hypothetical protein
MIVHVFNNNDFKHLHGKEIELGRFRYEDESQLPSPALLWFHYKQCMIKHLRGRSHFHLP